MSFFLDLVIILIFALMVFIGYKNGFIKSILNTFSTLISLGIAFVFSKYVSAYFMEHFFRSKVTEKVTAAFDGLMKTGNGNLKMDQLFEESPEAFRKIISSLGVNFDSLKDKFSGAISSGSASLKEDVVDYIASPIAQVISDVLAFLLLFIVSLIILSIACSLLDLVCKLPVLKQLNSFLGILFGIVTGFLTVWAISTGLSYLLPVLSRLYPEQIRANVIDNTLIVKALADTNLLKLITGVTGLLDK